MLRDAIASFPASVWDGLSATRLADTDYQWPSPQDYDRIRAELIAQQTAFLGNWAAAVAAGTDPRTININDKLVITTKDIILPIGASAVASVNLGYDIPANSLVLGAAMNIESAITLATATKIGLGITGALSKYGLVTGGTKNNKSTLAITPTALAAAEDLLIAATDNSGAAAGTIQNGSIRVRLTLLTQAALDNAA